MAADAQEERLKALRDADDDWDENAGKSAIEIGKLDVWEEQKALKNADGTVADTAFDGFMRLGTTREILSWPGNSGETHLVRTEGDEAKAQARLKKERTALRNYRLSEAALDKASAKDSHRERVSEYTRRQRERLEQEQREKKFDKSARKKAYEQNMQEWARVDEPGYGPDRWLWPKAYVQPRTYVTPGGDVAIAKGSRNGGPDGGVAGGPGAALGVPLSPEQRLSSVASWSPTKPKGSPSKGSSKGSPTMSLPAMSPAMSPESPM